MWVRRRGWREVSGVSGGGALEMPRPCQAVGVTGRTDGLTLDADGGGWGGRRARGRWSGGGHGQVGKP